MRNMCFPMKAERLADKLNFITVDTEIEGLNSVAKSLCEMLSD